MLQSRPRWTAAGIDVLVNNAGHGLLGALEELTDQQIREVLEREPARRHWPSRVPCCPTCGLAAAATSCRCRRSVVSSETRATPFYATSKFALEGASEALAGEVAPFGIRVTLVEPGPFRTDFLGRSLGWRRCRSRTTQTVRRGRCGSGSATGHGRQPGDPALAVEAIIATVRDESAPLRLPLGQAAVERIRDKLHAQLAELEAFADLALSTDRPAGWTGPRPSQMTTAAVRPAGSPPAPGRPRRRRPAGPPVPRSRSGAARPAPGRRGRRRQRAARLVDRRRGEDRLHLVGVLQHPQRLAGHPGRPQRRGAGPAAWRRSPRARPGRCRATPSEVSTDADCRTWSRSSRSAWPSAHELRRRARVGHRVDRPAQHAVGHRASGTTPSPASANSTPSPAVGRLAAEQARARAARARRRGRAAPAGPGCCAARPRPGAARRAGT